jgi:hypothetical protein
LGVVKEFLKGKTNGAGGNRHTSAQRGGFPLVKHNIWDGAAGGR